METNTTIQCPCPNCGSSATRIYFKSCAAIYERCTSNRVVQTECPICDYLMIMCALDGIVIEAYAPSTSALIDNSKLPLASSGNKKGTVFC